MSETLLETLYAVLEERKKADPETSYTAKLFAKAPDAILKKIGEETTELVMATKDKDRGQVVYETADIWFHILVLLSHLEIKPQEILTELERRLGVSGLDEKAARKKRLEQGNFKNH